MASILQRQVLSSEVFELLRERITILEIFPGSRIDIPSLSKELQVSAIPIREAIKRLAERGLIVSTAGIGYHAVQIDEDTVRDVFALRQLLEKDAILGVQVQFRRNQITRAREHSLQLLSQLVPIQTLRRLFDAVDAELHTGIIINSSSNRMMRDFYRQMDDITTIITHLNDRIEQSLHEHVSILDALLANDIEEARERLLLHLRNAEEACLPVPSSEEGWLKRYRSIYGLETYSANAEAGIRRATSGRKK